MDTIEILYDGEYKALNPNSSNFAMMYKLIGIFMNHGCIAPNYNTLIENRLIGRNANGELQFVSYYDKDKLTAFMNTESYLSNES